MELRLVAVSAAPFNDEKEAEPVSKFMRRNDPFGRKSIGNSSLGVNLIPPSQSVKLGLSSVQRRCSSISGIRGSVYSDSSPSIVKVISHGE